MRPPGSFFILLFMAGTSARLLHGLTLFCLSVSFCCGSRTVRRGRSLGLLVEGAVLLIWRTLGSRYADSLLYLLCRSGVSFLLVLTAMSFALPGRHSATPAFWRRSTERQLGISFL